MWNVHIYKIATVGMKIQPECFTIHWNKFTLTREVEEMLAQYSGSLTHLAPLNTLIIFLKFTLYGLFNKGQMIHSVLRALTRPWESIYLCLEADHNICWGGGIDTFLFTLFLNIDVKKNLLYLLISFLSFLVFFWCVLFHWTFSQAQVITK